MHVGLVAFFRLRVFVVVFLFSGLLVACSNDNGTIEVKSPNTPTTNKSPIANAGADQTVNEGATVTLDGSASSDPDGQIAKWEWSQVAGTTVTLSTPNSTKTTFKAPDINKTEQLSFTLKVTDNSGATHQDSLIVTVNARDQIVPTITLKGSNPITIARGEMYVDAGASAVDDVDGVVEVTTQLGVDTNKIGIYEVTYQAKDKAGNTSTISRKVNVVYPAPLNVIVNPTEQSFLVKWEQVAGASTYAVCYATVAITDLNSCTQLAAGTLISTTTPEIEIKPVPAQQGVTYYFRISAYDLVGAYPKGFASAQVSAVLLKPVQATGKLNDTGITACSNATENNLPCPVDGFPNQDAQSGRDVTHNDNSDGYAGFSFTKISSKGLVLPASATEWSCVKDNVTGLVWEVKTDDGSWHDKDWTYSWYEPDSTKNGGNAGVQNAGQCGATSACDTYGFVQKVNETGWCGATDWRMPTRTELFGLTRLDRYQHPVTDKPTIDTDYFPNTTSTVAEYGEYALFWSSSPNVAYDNNAWAVNFGGGNGNVSWDSKANTFQVRLVRSGQ